MSCSVCCGLARIHRSFRNTVAGIPNSVSAASTSVSIPDPCGPPQASKVNAIVRRLPGEGVSVDSIPGKSVPPHSVGTCLAYVPASIVATCTPVVVVCIGRKLDGECWSPTGSA